MSNDNAPHSHRSSNDPDSVRGSAPAEGSAPHNENSADEIGRRELLAAGGLAAGAMALGGLAQGQDIDGRQGIDLPGERTAALGSPRAMAIPQGWRGLDTIFYEMSANNPKYLEIFGYCDEPSYAAGETVRLHITTTAPVFDIEIYRDGPTREIVYQQRGIRGKFSPTPRDAYENGCDWPVLHEVPVPRAWRSGAYIVLLRVEKDGVKRQAEAFFVVRGSGKAKIAYLLTTCTWTAYNAWGGANHYMGIAGPNGDAASPVLSMNRPWERGFIVAPENFPLATTVVDRLRYEKEADFTCAPWPGYPFMMGYAHSANSAGWALDNRPFAIWAEENGYEMEYLTQLDLDTRPELLRQYKLLIITGHDEYWSWAQRDAVDAFLEGGGKMARFAANMLWQVRISKDNQQICYKVAADERDPVAKDPRQRHLLTTIWEHRSIRRPAAHTFGVTGLQGIYHAYDGGSSRGSAGFTVYRPDHWCFKGTNLLYGDTFGSQEGVVGYEIDSVDYVIKYGLPYPSDLHSPLEGTEILAVTPGMVDQVRQGGEGSAVLALGTSDFYTRYYAQAIEGKQDKETLDKYRYGSAQIVVAPKGRGEIFCAGTVYWFLGLKWKNRTVEQITHNVLKRYA